MDGESVGAAVFGPAVRFPPGVSVGGSDVGAAVGNPGEADDGVGGLGTNRRRAMSHSAWTWPVGETCGTSTMLGSLQTNGCPRIIIEINGFVNLLGEDNGFTSDCTSCAIRCGAAASEKLARTRQSTLPSAATLYLRARVCTAPACACTRVRARACTRVRVHARGCLVACACSRSHVCARVRAHVHERALARQQPEGRCHRRFERRTLRLP